MHLWLLLSEVTAELEPSYPSSHPPLAAHTSDGSTSASQIPPQKGRNNTSTPLFRRDFQCFCAFYHPGIQTLRPATWSCWRPWWSGWPSWRWQWGTKKRRSSSRWCYIPLEKHELLQMPITDMFCLKDKKISSLEKKLQPLCESGELPQTQVDFGSFLRFNYLIWAVYTLCVPRQHRWSERQKLSGKEMWTTAEPSVGDGGQIW